MISFINNSSEGETLNLFLYQIVLISLITGKAIERIINGYASSIRNRRNIIHSPTLYIWMLCALIVNIQSWWVWWNFRDVVFSFHNFFLGFSNSTLLLFFTYIIVPDFSTYDVGANMMAEKKYSLREYYFKNSDWFSFSAAILIPLLAAWNLYSHDHMSSSVKVASCFDQKLTFRFLFWALLGITGVSGVFLKKMHSDEPEMPLFWRRVHLACSIFFLIALLIFVSTFTDKCPE